ncbi:hypothetical protein CEXT_15651 [Caerostris extrusa]|uniref:Uncharacterized protein n=1 Tax=Caerostris extrusa TaxID=172846 RepID=A0AAV4MGD3_CAEEX|nr:hypothetical protein CEXT_15651 [Caerostris extrusa]
MKEDFVDKRFRPPLPEAIPSPCTEGVVFWLKNAAYPVHGDGITSGTGGRKSFYRRNFLTFLGGSGLPVSVSGRCQRQTTLNHKSDNLDISCRRWDHTKEDIHLSFKHKVYIITKYSNIDKRHFCNQNTTPSVHDEGIASRGGRKSFYRRNLLSFLGGSSLPASVSGRCQRQVLL